ncbi:glycosyl hydrolase family 5 [Flavobacterium album]|uniref:Glycosyl hydrolase family 5 n=1 Tax=Flavobacterium album TaxID=2175091 RepID=A0A2S1QYL5_9FLAO|nr:cellulase family glycosylhydrolase [Flavobacterium album]AWH85488.1 glycosyl hydrolase family 5 [Flavobacterium album]
MTNKTKLILFFLAFAGLLSSCKSYSTYGDNGKVYKGTISKTKGTQILDSNGDPITLKGTNIGNWLVPEGYMFKMGKVSSPTKINELLLEMVGPDSLKVFWGKYLDNYITQEDIKYLKRTGSNHIRLPFHYKLFTKETYMGKRNVGFEYMDRIIEWCRQENMYVLLDMHCAPGGQTGDNIDDSAGYPWLYFSKSAQDEMSDIWKKIASHYKDDPIVLGYDVINEPFAHYFAKEIPDYNHRLFLVYERMVKDIRSVDTKHTIYLNGSMWAGDFGVFERVLDENVVYEFHKYWFDINQEAIQKYIDFRDKYNVPIYIGETGENTDEWVMEFRKLLDENKVNWAFWPYKKMDNLRGIMNFKQPEDYPLITKYADSDRSSYEKVRENMPDRVKVQKALNEFLENCKYKNNFQNKGYIEGLGFTVE